MSPSVKTAMRFSVLACGLLTMIPGANAAEWKVFGAHETNGKKELLFFQADGVVRKPSGYVQVWVKILKQSDIDRVAGHKDKQRAGRMVERLLSGYVPPILRNEKKNDADQVFYFTLAEDVASTAEVKVRTRILYEVDCAERLVRTLSVYVANDKSSKSSDEVGTWAHVAPESNADELLPLVCAAGPTTPAGAPAKPGGKVPD